MKKVIYFLLFVLIIVIANNDKLPAPETKDYANESNSDSAIKELKQTPWVKDLYVSPGHLNVGVILGEKDWQSTTIAVYVCAILKRNGSNLTWVRFVDIAKVVYQKQSVSQAEISKFTCRDIL